MSGAVAAARPPWAEASRTLLRESVLDGVGELLGDKSWEEVTMAAVAERAGVSRQTLYNEFGSRRELARVYVMREAQGFLDSVGEAVLSNGADPRRALTAALETFLSAAQTHPVVRAIVAGDEGDELLALVTTRGEPVLTEMTTRLADVLNQNWPTVSAGDARLLAETLVRLAISHAALPTATPRRTAESVTRALGPFADELVAG